MNLLKTNRSPFRLIALMAILFAILFVTFFPGIEETRSEFRIRHAYNTVCRLAKSETALIEHQAANAEDQNDPWGNPYGIAELAEGLALFHGVPMELPQPPVSIETTSTPTWLIHQAK